MLHLVGQLLIKKQLGYLRKWAAHITVLSMYNLRTTAQNVRVFDCRKVLRPKIPLYGI